MMRKCKDCGTLDGIIQNETGLCISCDRRLLITEIKQLKNHINCIKKEHDYWDIRSCRVKAHLKTAIINASQFSLREELE